MKRILLITALLSIPAVAPAQEIDLIDSALAQVGMSHEDVRFDTDEMATWGGDKWRLTYFTMFHQNPFKLPKYGQMNLESFTTDGANVSALIANAGRKIDCPVRRSLIGDPLEKYTTRNDSVPLPSFTRNRNALAGEKFDKLKDKIDLIYALIDDPDFIFTRAYEQVDVSKARRETFSYFVSDSQKYNDLMEELAGKIDFGRMVGGAEDLAEAIRRAADSLEFCAFPDFQTEIQSPKGLIVIGTKGKDVYTFRTPPLLILDPGGDDTYRISGYSEGYPLSAIIDAAGSDRYLSSDTTVPGIGGAVLGMSVVIDKSGDDRYEAKNVAQGCGIFGVGAVMDNEGRDIYLSKSNAQGCGIFGIGILSDGAGDDSLYCWSNAQGYGYTRGCGLCINGAGNDVYVAEDSILFSPGQQTQEHNSSLAQGAGFGKRADYIDNHSWAGGVGILCDIAGDDRYRAGLFAQGCGYWFALGMLIDGTGNDDYYSTWYTLGSGAHFAIGYLDDFSGNDSYNATMNMSIGSGHDFTIGYFNERNGNDTYYAPGLSAGGGNFQGIGIFDDWYGDDNYITSGQYMLGGARGLTQGPRTYLNTFGIFIDGGGSDTYKEAWAKNGVRWITPRADSTVPTPVEIGVGLDR